MQRSFEHLFDLRAPWFHSFCVMGRLWCITVGMWVSGIVAYCGLYHTARRVYGFVVFFGNGLINGFPHSFANFIYFAGTTQQSCGIYPLVGSLTLGCYFGGICLFAEGLLVRGGRVSVFLVAIVWMVAVGLFDLFFLYGGMEFLAATAMKGNGIEVFMFMTFLSVLTIFRQKILGEAWQDIQEDMHEYDSLWSKALEDPSSARARAKLSELTHMYGKNSDMPTIVQHTVVTGTTICTHNQLLRCTQKKHRANLVACITAPRVEKVESLSALPAG